MKANKFLAFFLAMAMLCALVLTGCGSSSEGGAPGDAASTAPTATGDAAEPEFVLTFNNYNAQTSTMGSFEVPALQMIEENSNGRIKVEGYWSATLLDAGDTFSGVSKGMADISMYMIDLNTGCQVVGTLFNLPYVQPMPVHADMIDILRESLATIPEIQEECEAKNVHLIDLFPVAACCTALTTDKPVLSPSDFSGLKLLTMASLSTYLSTYGGSVISQAPGDWYSSLEKGVVDGDLNHFAALNDFGLTDLMKSYTMYGDNGGVYSCAQCYMINLETWNSLPEDLQLVVADAFTWCDDSLVEKDAETIAATIQSEKDAGKSFYHVEQEDMDVWYEAANIAVDGWKTAAAETGCDSERIWNDYQNIISNYMKNY